MHGRVDPSQVGGPGGAVTAGEGDHPPPGHLVLDCAGDGWTVLRAGSAARLPVPPGTVGLDAPADLLRAWTAALRAACADDGPPDTIRVLVPSLFGAARRSLVTAAAAGVGAAATTVPRALAIAERQSVPYRDRLLVIEAGATGHEEESLAHLVIRADGKWMPTVGASGTAGELARRFDAEADTILVDGPDRLYAQTREAFAARGMWCVLAVDRDRLVIDEAAIADRMAPPAAEPGPVHRHRRRAAVGAALCLVAAVVAIVAAPRPPGQYRTVELTGALVELPARWAVNAPDPARRIATGPAGARITVVFTALRAPATRARVAAELRAALAAHPDPRIENLRDRLRYGDREVIAYRQRTRNRSVSWFLWIDGPAQLAIGCEPAGADPDELDAACRHAVATIGAR